MRSLKKITAVVIALAMVLGLMSVSVFAADGVTIDIEASSATVGQSKTVIVDVYCTVAADTDLQVHGFNLEFTAPAGVTVTDVSPDGSLFKKGDNTIEADQIILGNLSGALKAGKTKVASFEFAVDANVAADETITFAIVGESFLNGSGLNIDVTKGAVPTITVVEAAEITEVAAENLTKPMLTSKEDIINALPKEVTITAPEKVKDKKVAVSKWECADYNDKIGTAQTFVGTLAPVDPITAKEGLTAIATVTLTQLTEVTLDEAKYNAVGVDVDSAGTEDAVKTAILAKYNKVSVNGGVDKFTLTKEMITVTDATDGDDATVLDTTAEDNKTTATIEIPADAESDAKIFKLAAAKKIADVEVIVEAAGIYTPPAGIGSVSGNGGGGIPTTKPEDKEDPADKPDTEEPGTEEPGTEEPGTEPGIDAPVAGLFEDVANDYWAADYIKQMKDMGVVSGKTATSFEPEATITRAEFVKMIAVAFGLEIGAADAEFADCGADDWYTPYVAAAAEAGYVNGISDTEFGANDPISRQDICTIIGRIMGMTDVEGSEVAFADADAIADYAMVAVKNLAAAGILSGYEDGTFAPTKSATRAEVCKILSSLLARVTEDGSEEEAADAVVEEEVVEEEVTEEVAEEATEEEVADEK